MDGRDHAFFTDMIREAVDEQVRRNHEVIELACERMLVMPGDYGVLVTHQHDGTVKAELTHDVPFGEIHYKMLTAGIGYGY